MRKTETVIRTPMERARILTFIQGLDIDKPWAITVTQHRKKRSLSQNRLIHKWFAIIAEHTGDSEESVKADLTFSFAPKIQSKTSEDVIRPMGTSEMNTVQMAEFVTRLYNWAGAFGIMLPHPDDQGRG